MTVKIVGMTAGGAAQRRVCIDNLGLAWHWLKVNLGCSHRHVTLAKALACLAQLTYDLGFESYLLIQVLIMSLLGHSVLAIRG